MPIRLLVFLLLSLLPLVALRLERAVGAAPSSRASLEAADALFSYGEDHARDQQALTLLERVLAREPQSYQALWRATRAAYHVGDEAEERAKVASFERGIQWGQQAVAQQPEGVEGHFWLGANYGGLSSVKGLVQALAMVQQVRTEMETALRLQADYEQGSAYRALGELARQLPGVLGGSRKRALAYLEQGVRVAPQNLALKLSLARAYREADQHEASRQQLREILHMPRRPARAIADSRTQDKARQLLAQ